MGGSGGGGWGGRGGSNGGLDVLVVLSIYMNILLHIDMIVCQNKL